MASHAGNAADKESVCSDLESDAERAADDETDLESEDATPDDPLIVARGPAASAGTHVIEGYGEYFTSSYMRARGKEGCV